MQENINVKHWRKFYETLDIHSKHAIDRAYAAMHEMLNMNGVTLAGDDRAEELVGAITHAVWSSNQIAKQKRFKVAAISSNANSFGLRSVIMIAQDSEAWQVLSNSMHLPQRGAVIELVRQVGYNAGSWNFAGYGWECPERHLDAPVRVINELWGKQPQKQHGEHECVKDRRTHCINAELDRALWCGYCNGRAIAEGK